MPSWNIHTAHVERLLTERSAERLGIGDSNAFLFGNYVPDIYVGFMVPDASRLLDYHATHFAVPSLIPVPDADRFWNEWVCGLLRGPVSASVLSLTLGAWVHLAADRVYNLRFRAFCDTHDTPDSEERRLLKQADLDLFGHSLGISSRVEATHALIEAAGQFGPYEICPDDVRRAIGVADEVVRDAGMPIDGRGYLLLSREWMAETFEACHEYIGSWLLAWQEIERERRVASSDAIRERM